MTHSSDFNMVQYLTNGGIYINNNFLSEDEFNKVVEEVKNMELHPTYQPENTLFGSRFEAFPCYETDYFSRIKSNILITFKLQIEELFGEPFHKFDMKLRKTLTEEVRRSAQNHKYGITHVDQSGYAGVFYFSQSINGGTAFFRNTFDRYPDIEIGALPNRLVVYPASYPHAPCTDFNTEDRYSLAMFFDTKLTWGDK